jgi:hypothetical protein
LFLLHFFIDVPIKGDRLSSFEMEKRQLEGVGRTAATSLRRHPMTKSILTALAVLFSLSAPAFAAGTVYQEEPASEQPEQPAGEGESSGGSD